MINKHITHILDEFAFDALNQIELATIETHVAECESCRLSFEAAKVSFVLLKTRSTETCSPSPFFETRLMARWRETQVKSTTAFWRWWQASNAVVSAIIVVVAALLIITLIAPKTSTNAAEQASLLENYSTEKVILNETDSSAQLTANQALQIIYEQQKSK